MRKSFSIRRLALATVGVVAVLLAALWYYGLLYQKKLTWVRGDAGGNWYRLEKPPMEGWLCPALFKYYREAPKELYVRADPQES